MGEVAEIRAMPVPLPSPSLAEQHPDVAAEWHPTRNGTLTPAMVAPSSSRKVWWSCDRGHDYLAYIGHRTRSRSGCPYCSHRSVLAGFNDMVTTHPHLAAEWHPTKNGTLTPDAVIAGTNRRFWWRCELGHEWFALSSHRAKIGGPGCTVCSNRKVLAGFNDLATTHPHLAGEWHEHLNGDLRPDEVVAGTDRIVWWRCPEGHDFEAPCSRRSGPRQGGCPVCSGRQRRAGVNDLATTHPHLAAEWHPDRNGGLTPQDVSHGKGTSVWWQCQDGHEWQQTITSRTRATSSPCPGCAKGRIVIPGVNDLASTHPDLAKQLHPTRNGDLDPRTILAGTETRLWWQCERGHEWEAVCYSRSGANKGGCPVCANARVLTGYNDLATTHPDLAAQWHPSSNHPLLPTEIVAGANRKIWWQCQRGHEWQALVNTRSQRGFGCPYCSGTLTLAGFNDLATTHPHVAAEWHPVRNGDLRPDQVATGASRRIWWQCSIGHEWIAVCSSRTGPSATCCPYCSNKKVLAGYNDLATTHPNLLVEWHPTRNLPLTPSEVVAGTPMKIWWLCAVGHEWQAVSGNRARLGVGCPDCCGTGFRPNSPALVYIVSNVHGHKVGVMGLESQRLEDHRRNGWQTMCTWRFSIGRDAYLVEQATLRRLRKTLGLPQFATVQQMRQGGATETVADVHVSLDDLIAMVEEVTAAVEREGTVSQPERPATSSLF